MLLPLISEHLLFRSYVMVKFTTFISLLILISVLGCQYQNSEDKFSPAICPDSAISYSLQVLPILESSCFKCHSKSNNAANASGINLEDFNTFKSYANKGILIGSIKHLPGFNAMPKDEDPLNPCNINMIEVWVSEGAKNN